MDDKSNPWITNSSEIVYENPWLKVIENKVINFSGNDGIYGVVHFKNLAIGIIPLTSDGYTWIVGQYRYPLKEYSWEIPEGGGKLNIDPIESAKRELSEETGLVAKKWTLIQEFNTSNSVTDEVSYIYLAQDLFEGKSHPDEDEDLNIRKIHFSKLLEMVLSGEVKDSLTVIAVYKLNYLISKGVVNITN